MKVEEIIRNPSYSPARLADGFGGDSAYGWVRAHLQPIHPIKTWVPRSRTSRDSALPIRDCLWVK